MWQDIVASGKNEQYQKNNKNEKLHSSCNQTIFNSLFI